MIYMQNQLDRVDLKTDKLNIPFYKSTLHEIERLETQLQALKSTSKNTAEIKELVSLIYYIQRARGMAERFVRANS